MSNATIEIIDFGGDNQRELETSGDKSCSLHRVECKEFHCESGTLQFMLTTFWNQYRKVNYICMLTTLQLLSLVMAPMHLLPVQCGNTALEYKYRAFTRPKMIILFLA